MKKIILILALCLLPINAHAERWIQCIATTVGTVNWENPQRVEGDCLSLGLCSGPNNTGIATNVFEAVGSEWNDAGGAAKKCDRLAPVGSRIINLTAQEIADIAAALDSQNESALRVSSKEQFNGQTVTGQSLRCMSNIIKDEINITRKWTRDFKIEVAAATNLADLKTRVATLPTLSDRTLAQFKSAMQTCIDNGDVDE